MPKPTSELQSEVTENLDKWKEAYQVLTRAQNAHSAMKASGQSHIHAFHL